VASDSQTASSPDVATFTDSYLPTINGVTYTVETIRDRWRERDNRMAVVYPDGDRTPDVGEYPIRSVRFPFYDGYRVSAPQIPDAVLDVDLVHAHTPFGVGLAGLRLARRQNLPFVVSYHTPTSEYISYLSSGVRLGRALRRLTRRYERWFLERADVVIVPSESTRQSVQDDLGVNTPVELIPNGVDTRRFRPVDTREFLAEYDLETAEPLVGYTGRHGYEKCLETILDAAETLDVTVVFGGDGPAREELAEEATGRDGVDARFLGFLDRDDLAAFYASLDVFLFPSPVETQGLVALEANACGTPVVGADSGALATTIDDDVTGYQFDTGNVEEFRAKIRAALQNQERLGKNCVARRDQTGVEHAMDRIESVYDRVEPYSSSSSAMRSS